MMLGTTNIKNSECLLWLVEVIFDRLCGTEFLFNLNQISP